MGYFSRPCFSFRSMYSCVQSRGAMQISLCMASGPLKASKVPLYFKTNIKTSRLVFTARLRPQFRMPPIRGSVVRIRGMMRTQHFWIRTSLSSTAAARRHAAIIVPLHATIGGRLPEWQTSKCISSVSFVRIESNFLQYIGDTDAKNDRPEF